MHSIPVVQIGVGGVGQVLIEQIQWFNQHMSNRYSLQFAYIGLVDRQGSITDGTSISSTILERALTTKQAGRSLVELSEGSPLADWRDVLPSRPCIIVDVTAQDNAEAGLVEAIMSGHYVVLANKKPLCASFETFVNLTEHHRTRYEATVGAGLPIISTLQSLLDTGDTVEQIEGCFSGTLGFLMTQLEQGVAFSEAVQDARGRGWTEPDPRDDLSGVDVARKALILARTWGIEVELDQVSVETLFSLDLAELTVADFMEQLVTLDQLYADKIRLALKEKKRLRYVAYVAEDGLHVGLAAVTPESPIGSLRGPDNLVLYRTERYNDYPLSIRGPGAGVEVTAAAVLNDMLAFANGWNQ
jgi:homoserine dehydrogenase